MMFKKAGLGGKARGLLFMEGEASSLGVFFLFYILKFYLFVPGISYGTWDL